MGLAFREAGLDFHKTRPCRLFLEKIGGDPEAVMTDGAKERIRRLFMVINERFERHTTREGPPFN